MKMPVMKWHVVIDVIKPVTDTDMAILGCLIHLSGCKPGGATPAVVSLTAQASLNLVVQSEQQVGLWYWSSSGDQAQGSWWVHPNKCCPMICIILFSSADSSFLSLCLPALCSLLLNKTPLVTFAPPFIPAFLHNQIWSFKYWYLVILALFGFTDKVTWAQLALQYPPTGLQYFK